MDILCAKAVILSQNNYTRVIIPNKITIILKLNAHTDLKKYSYSSKDYRYARKYLRTRLPVVENLLSCSNLRWSFLPVFGFCCLVGLFGWFFCFLVCLFLRCWVCTFIVWLIGWFCWVFSYCLLGFLIVSGFGFLIKSLFYSL